MQKTDKYYAVNIRRLLEMVTFVEAENKEKLLDFYEKYGYKRFATRQTLSDEPHQLIQLLKLI